MKLIGFFLLAICSNILSAHAERRECAVPVVAAGRSVKAQITKKPTPLTAEKREELESELLSQLDALENEKAHLERLQESNNEAIQEIQEISTELHNLKDKSYTSSRIDEERNRLNHAHRDALRHMQTIGKKIIAAEERIEEQEIKIQSTKNKLSSADGVEPKNSNFGESATPPWTVLRDGKSIVQVQAIDFNPKTYETIGAISGQKFAIWDVGSKQMLRNISVPSSVGPVSSISRAENADLVMVAGGLNPLAQSNATSLFVYNSEFKLLSEKKFEPLAGMKYTVIPKQSLSRDGDEVAICLETMRDGRGGTQTLKFFEIYKISGGQIAQDARTSFALESREKLLSIRSLGSGKWIFAKETVNNEITVIKIDEFGKRETVLFVSKFKHSDQNITAALSHKGDRLALNSVIDGQSVTRIWKLAEPKNPQVAFTEKAPVAQLLFSPDGKMLLSHTPSLETNEVSTGSTIIFRDTEIFNIELAVRDNNFDNTELNLWKIGNSLSLVTRDASYGIRIWPLHKLKEAVATQD
jgi:WD40 repeat protein